jgi:transcriptional regulator with XRE-family HTH domain
MTKIPPDSETREVLDRLTRTIRRTNMSGAEFARKAGVAPSTVTQLHGSKFQDIRLAIFVKLARALPISYAELFGEKPQMGDAMSEELMKRLRYEFGLVLLRGDSSLREMVIVQQLSDIIDRVEREMFSEHN